MTLLEENQQRRREGIVKLLQATEWVPHGTLEPEKLPPVKHEPIPETGVQMMLQPNIYDYDQPPMKGLYKPPDGSNLLMLSRLFLPASSTLDRDVLSKAVFVCNKPSNKDNLYTTCTCPCPECKGEQE